MDVLVPLPTYNFRIKSDVERMLQQLYEKLSFFYFERCSRPILRHLMYIGCCIKLTTNFSKPKKTFKLSNETARLLSPRKATQRNCPRRCTKCSRRSLLSTEPISVVLVVMLAIVKIDPRLMLKVSVVLPTFKTL